ncbi:MAG: hypothetical protein H6732_15345 [Alphaproteobacteria bacterium]|nr:hypothetical protein [Alphaproteobacteria bacterium]
MSSRPHPAHVLAALLPALLVAAWLAWALGPVPPPDSAHGRAMDAAVDAADPQLVVLGNSATRMAIDPDSLARDLGMPGRVVALTVDGFASAGWLALLRHHVVARGARPALVLVASTDGFALSALGQEPFALQRLAEHLDPDDRDIADRVGVGSGWTERWRLHRLALRARVLDVVRAVAALPFAREPTWTEAVATAARARHAVLGPLGVADPAAPRGLLPEVVPVPAAVGWTDSLLLELVAEVRSLEATLVYVRLPVHTAGPDGAEEAAVLRAHLEAEGAVWVDLTDLPFPEGDWEDPTHLAPSGRTRLTAELTRRLTARGLP